MATSMSSAFTMADRRKKVVTYGRSARLAAPAKWSEDATSPERPRKQADSSNNGPLRRPGGILGTGSTLGNTRANPPKLSAAHDIFDVPSDEEHTLVPSAPRAKKAPPKAKPIDPFDVPSSEDETPRPSRRPAKSVQSSRKAEPAQSSVGTYKSKLTEHEQVEAPSSSDPLAPPTTRRRAKTPQAAQKPEGGAQPRPAKRTGVKPRATRATTPAAPAAPVIPSQKKAKESSVVLVKQPVMAKTTTKKAPEWDIFDVPPSDDEAPLWRPNKPRPAPLSRAKAAFTSRTVAQPSPEPSNDSDDSNTSKKRKRQGSISSSATVKAAQVERECEPSVLHRNKKYQKKEDSVSPGHDTSKVSLPIQAVEEQPRGFAINKPKRTRTRTVPVQAKPPIAKGQSSPATLSGMLAVRSLPKPSPVPEVSEVQAAEDETMYDIPDPETPVVKLRKAPISGSVTPRQNALFSNLLGDSAESATPMPSISRLRLTDQRPSSVLAGLTRSSSDIPQSALTRKTRLIDMLKQSAPSSDDDSESDEETEEDIPEIPAVSVPAKTAANGVGATDDASDEMDVDSEAQVDSQASQTTVQLHSGARITYAKQRSYLEESNLEDGLLLAMGLDDDFGPNKDQNLVSEDEDDPASQVRGIHELRRQGQHYKFQVEAENSIDDISGKSGLNASQRRSAMMDFATRMADRTFIDQLLESALTYRLLESISYAREIIFDFAAAVAVLHILETGPGYTVLDQMYQSGIMVTLSNLLDSHNDIYRIARDRKTNMAKSAQGTVAEFRDLILKSSVWPAEKLEKVSPQLVAMKTLELLILGIRKAGNDEALIDEDTIAKLVSITRNACQRLKVGKATSQDLMTLDIAFSILEAVSLSKDGQTTWSNEVLRRLAEIMPVFFETSGASPIRLVVRLCMNITNNKPKACQSFAGPTFVLPLVRSISHRFKLLAGELDEQQRTEVMEGLILSLGAMINLAEFSDQARMSVVQEGDGLVDELAQIFLDGSERADRADSMEESQSSVTIGYLSILLGNLCLNDTVRAKVQSRLPRNKIDILVQKVKEFVLYNQKVDRLAGQFEGEEGRETLRNFTMRLMLVVERLEKVGA